MYGVFRGGDPGTKKKNETVSWDSLETGFVEQACQTATATRSESSLEVKAFIQVRWLHMPGSLELRRLRQEDTAMGSTLAWIGRVGKWREERYRIGREEMETSSPESLSSQSTLNKNTIPSVLYVINISKITLESVFEYTRPTATLPTLNTIQREYVTCNIQFPRYL